MQEGARQRSRQPASMALPMRPQPTRRMDGIMVAYPRDWFGGMMPYWDGRVMSGGGSVGSEFQCLRGRGSRRWLPSLSTAGLRPFPSFSADLPKRETRHSAARTGSVPMAFPAFLVPANSGDS